MDKTLEEKYDALEKKVTEIENKSQSPTTINVKFNLSSDYAGLQKTLLSDLRKQSFGWC